MFTSKSPKNNVAKRSDRGPIAAVLAGTILMFASGLAFSSMATRLGTPITALPISPETLSGFPMDIGDWSGQDVPLDDVIAEKTDADAHVNRRYTRADGGGSILLYVACGVDWEMMFHRPDVCYPGSGWTIADRQVLEIPVRGRAKLPCTLFRFERGELEAEEMVVLYYCIADGTTYSDVSLLQSRVWGVFDAVDYRVQVQIVASSLGSSAIDSRTTLISEFAAISAPSIAQLCERIETRAEAGGGDLPEKGGDR